MKVIGPEIARGKAMAAAALAAPAGADGTAIAVPAARESQAAKLIELAKVNGQVQAQSLERIGELVKNNPIESVSVLRQWLHERT